MGQTHHMGMRGRCDRFGMLMNFDMKSIVFILMFAVLK